MLKKYFAIFTAFLVILIPLISRAAQINFQIIPNSNSSDGATIIEARVNPEGKKLNVVEGTIKFQGTAVNNLSVGIETGSSVLTLWPTPPVYANNAIRFTGGVPLGFDTDSLLFRLRLSSTQAGEAEMSWVGGTAYLNDGKGTKEPLTVESFSVNLSAQTTDSVASTSPDTTAPTFQSTEIGQDASVYDGKKFINLMAIDDVSGVARYEVREGDDTTIVENGIYVFKDQTRRTPITVSVIDQAGNTRVMEIPGASSDWQKNAIIILIIIFVLALVVRYVYKKIIKK